MSYCRWSSDDYQCDVYCYADVNGGYTTHVASNRVTLPPNLPPAVPFTGEHLDEWMARHKILMDGMANAVRSPIGLPCDGASYNDSTAKDAAHRLIELRAVGYNVPQYAIDALMEEID